MTMKKVAVSLPEESVERARAAVRVGLARSFSAYVAAAIEEKAKMDDLASMLDEMLATTGGPMTDQERAAADRAFRGTKQRPRRAAR